MMPVEPIDATRGDRHESSCEPQSIFENTVDGETCGRPFVPFGHNRMAQLMNAGVPFIVG